MLCIVTYVSRLWESSLLLTKCQQFINLMYIKYTAFLYHLQEAVKSREMLHPGVLYSVRHTHNNNTTV